MEATVKKTWKSTIAAVLILIAIFTSAVTLKIATEIGIPRLLSIIILWVIPAIGVLGAFRRRWYNWTLTGSICSILGMPLLGIPALILIISAKREFQSPQKSSNL